MAIVRFTTNQNYHWRYADLEDYRISSINEKTGIMRLVYDEDRAGRPFEGDRSPWSVKVSMRDVETYKPEYGDYKGKKIITDGTVTKVEWFNKGGKLQVEMKEVGLDAGLFQLYMLEEPWRAYSNLVSEGSTFNGPKSNKHGMDVDTGWGNDVVNAGRGGSYIKDSGGADRYVGTNADEWDTVTYDQWFYARFAPGKGVKADLRAGEAKGPDGKTDKLIDIERVIGTNRKDELLGDGDHNAFAGLRGYDFINGRGGFDRVQYYQDQWNGGMDGIRADLSIGRIRDGFGTFDRVKNIEAVEGTETSDVFIGNKKDNWFRGRDGADKFVFKGNDFGEDYIDDFSRQQGDKIDIKLANKFSDLEISSDENGTLVKYNDNSTIFLEEWTSGLKASDFIF